MKKLVNALKELLSFAIVLSMVFGAGYYLGRNANENKSIAAAEGTNDFDMKLPLEKEKRVVTVEEVESKLAEIGELSTYFGEYTSTHGKDETRYWLEKIPVLGSTNSIEITGKGIVKVGYNISDIGVKVGDEKIYISIPKVQLNDNYIIWDSVECRESNNILNPIEFDQYQEIIQDIESKGLQEVTAKGIYQRVVARKSVSSAVLGGEGFFNLSLQGNGVVALECNVPEEELIEVELDNDILKIDGNLAVCWSSDLDFTVERTTKTLVGSAVSGEGLVNVYRGTGRVLMSPVAPASSLYDSTNTIGAKTAAKNSNTFGK